MRKLLAVFALAGLSGCATLPEVPASQSSASNDPWPALMPIDRLLAEASEFRIDDEDRRALQARAARLQARAAALRRIQP